jgi:hypothetical protein
MIALAERLAKQLELCQTMKERIKMARHYADPETDEEHCEGN